MGIEYWQPIHACLSSVGRALDCSSILVKLQKSHKSSGRWFDSDRQDKRNNNNEQTLLLFYEDTI
jgi:hypothetical protein